MAADDDYERAFDDYEYRLGLLQERTCDDGLSYRAGGGEFVGEGRWTREGEPLAELRMREESRRAADSWPWWSVAGGRDAFDETLDKYRQTLAQLKRWG